MAAKLFDDHTPKCEYCVHVRREAGEPMCVRRRSRAEKPCFSFCYDPLKRIPRQEARLPEYNAADFAIIDFTPEDIADICEEFEDKEN